MEKIYQVKGMTCVICKKNVENALNDVDGVNSANVNLIENEVIIDYDETKINEEILSKVIKNAGYSLVLNTSNKLNIDKIKLIISIMLVAILMFLSMNTNEHLSIYLQAILSLIIIVLNINFYKSGFRSLFKLNPNMDSLVSISSFVSYIYSLYSSYQILNGLNGYHLFFETASMVLVIVAIGKLIEGNTKSKAVKTIRGLATLIPMQANLIKDGKIIVVPINEIKKNDVVEVLPGESIPQDGIIIKGSSSIDESMITGESLSVHKNINDEVIGGTINLTGKLEVKITKSNNTSVLANIINLTKKATMEKIPIERIADKMSKYFVFTVLAISLITFVIWMYLDGSSERALNFALSVLVISCPCALGLATPAAIAVANGKAARNGILIKKPEILENINKVKTIVFDKTGTLTQNKLSIVEINEFDSEFINVLSSLEKNSNHPISKTILEKYSEGKLKFDTSESISGLGIKATLNNDIYLTGNSSLVDIPQEYLEYAKNNNYSLVGVSKNDKLLGVIYLSDVLRQTSNIAISNLYKRNINPVMCTGDNRIASSRIASLLNIKEYKYEVKPEDKNELIMDKKKLGKVIMVGDGINDAIALTNADISITIKNSTDLASASSDVILMKNDLNDISFLYDLSIKTMKIIKENLLWALGYNAILIPIAAGIFYKSLGLELNPMIGAISMWVSSMFVLLNALRINNLKKEEINIMNKTVYIEGMMCQNCKRHVEEALASLGLEFEVFLEEKKAIIKNTSIDNETLTKVIEEKGYEVKEIIND